MLGRFRDVTGFGVSIWEVVGVVQGLFSLFSDERGFWFDFALWMSSDGSLLAFWYKHGSGCVPLRVRLFGRRVAGRSSGRDLGVCVRDIVVLFVVFLDALRRVGLARSDGPDVELVFDGDVFVAQVT